MMLKEVVVASKNQGKIKEFSIMLSELGIKVRSMDEFENIPNVVEDGETFEENAIKKAEEICNIINLPVIADDSGLMVDALNGEPGIYSARYAGNEKDDKKNNEKLLASLKNVEVDKRTARFVCVIALAVPGKETIITKGICEGIIGFNLKGDNGFGYDPLFYLPKYDKTMAEISIDLKNSISHRSKALKGLVDTLVTTKII